jgi:hypothetical protein
MCGVTSCTALTTAGRNVLFCDIIFITMTFRNPGTANEKALALWGRQSRGKLSLLPENTLRSDPTFKNTVKWKVSFHYMKWWHLKITGILNKVVT